MRNSFTTLLRAETAYTVLIAWVTISLCLGFGIAGIASAQDSGLEEIENTTIETTSNTSYVELDIEFAETMENTSEETVEFTTYTEAAYQDDGTELSDYDETLSGTTLTVNEDVHDHATYDVELDSSATTVTVDGTAFADDGTVDLSGETSDSLTSDDTVLSISVTADTIITDTVTGTPNDTVTNEYQLSDTGFESGVEYRALVEVGNANNIASGYVAPDDATIGGGFFDGADGSPGFGVGVAIAALATAGVLARRRS
ncbi:PGF-CTERM protein [Halobiforma haloterrestris]|uniref:PGF-CTERM protein n=1 Tax=Natronobacterium haloterrestre TaxID=148448 RepID=A0A1I1L6M2_NATHA|nr:PGF-CTERM sorting domain-containing protein [Halobiforma haloterrestris]SFC65220.1 PGF-CTERM protein [Halobiforma haloterrestris]